MQKGHFFQAKDIETQLQVITGDLYYGLRQGFDIGSQFPATKIDSV